MIPCGKKFEFMEADNIYIGFCCEGDLCQDCSQKPPEHIEKKRIKKMEKNLILVERPRGSSGG